MAESRISLTLSRSPLLFVEGSYSHGIKYEIIPSSEASSTMALVIWTSDSALNVKSLEQLESKSSDFSFFTINDSMGQNKLRKTRLEQTRLKLFYESKFGGFKVFLSSSHLIASTPPSFLFFFFISISWSLLTFVTPNEQ